MASDTTSTNDPANPAKPVNIVSTERWSTAFAGGGLATYGLLRKDPLGYALGALGLGLIYRASTGHCSTYQALGINNVPAEDQGAVRAKLGDVGIKVVHSVTVNASPDTLYAYWRDFTNLPHIMDHLNSVTVQTNGRSHWVAKAPLGRTVEWDAEIINEVPGQLIAWQSLPGADVDNAGSVRFKPGPTGRGTEVRVELSYAPPAGKAGATVAKLLGEEPKKQLDDDLRHFKQLMETGERPTTEGQASGRGPDKDQVK